MVTSQGLKKKLSRSCVAYYSSAATCCWLLVSCIWRQRSCRRKVATTASRKKETAIQRYPHQHVVACKIFHFEEKYMLLSSNSYEQGKGGIMIIISGKGRSEKLTLGMFVGYVSGYISPCTACPMNEINWIICNIVRYLQKKRKNHKNPKNMRTNSISTLTFPSKVSALS